MLLKYFYDTRLAHASYLVGCQESGEALVVDPGREIEPYLAEAGRQDLRIVGAVETHIHADFVSGARELADRVGATLYLSDEGPEPWKYHFATDHSSRLLRDGDHFMLGNLRFDVLHTPGHTPEHLVFLLTDTIAADEPVGLFSGDCLFVGSVGRPDLLEEAAGEMGSARELAREMFASLARLRELEDHIQVWPAHGAGSACGKGLGAVPSSTIGYEKKFNWALQIDDEARFIDELLEGQPEPPSYFAEMKRVNRDGPAILGGLPPLERLAEEQLVPTVESGAPVIDTRPAAAFASGHLPGTINIPFDGAFLTWMGWLAPYDRAFYLIGDQERSRELMSALISIGLEHVGGLYDADAVARALSDGRSLERYRIATPDEVAERVASGELAVVDVRARSEWDEGHIPQARHIMLGYLSERANELPADRPILVHCRSGARSAIGASLLQAAGYEDVTNLEGGFDAWKREGHPVSDNGTG